MNNPIILHRTIGSTYSQKAMAMLGFANAEWQSVIANKGVPRPEQEILVGSFARRMPILQIGADLYCDTDMISHTLSEKLNQPNFDRLQLSKTEQEKVWQIETEFFPASIGSVHPINFVTGYFRTVPFKVAIDFLKDRIATAKNAKNQNVITTKSREQWKQIAIKHFSEMQNILEKSAFLSGTDTPNIIDFTTLTHVYYMNVLNKLKFAKPYPKVKEWLDKMNAFGTGKFSEISAEKALEVAKKTEPMQISKNMTQSEKIGKEIEVEFNDELGKSIVNPLTGILVGEDDYKYIVKRENKTVGTVYIHIPKQCFGACG